MKWLLLVCFLALGVYWSNFLKTGRRSVYFSGLLMGFLPFILNWWHLLCAPYSFAGWAGYCKGWEITIIDVLAAAIVLSSKLKTPAPPMRRPIMIYIAAVAVAVPMAPYFNIAAAYFFQMLRMLLVFTAVSRLAARDDGAKGVIYGLISGIALQCFFALQARLQGALQTGGTFGHQNLLGFVTHMVLLPSFCLLLGGRWPRMAGLGVFTGACVVLLTASRATIAIAGVGIVISYIAAASTNWTSRKAVFGAVTVVILLIATPIAQQSLGRRFAGNNSVVFGEDPGRNEFERAADMMIADHPFGIGPNHYVFAVNVFKYNDRAKVSYFAGNRAATVHNGYLLVTAETGYLGLIAFCWMLIAIVWTCLSSAKKYRKQGYSELILGVGCGVVAVMIHSKYEWMFVMYGAQYVIFTGIGLASGCILLSQRKAEKRQPRRDRPVEADTVEHVPGVLAS